MDIGQAFRFVFEDAEWFKKILLGALIMLIPLFGPLALMGYGIAVVRNVKRGAARPLPHWDRLGEYFMDGLKLWVIMLVYSLPILIIMCPAALVGALPALGGESEELLTILGGISTVLIIGMNCIATVYGLALALLTPIIQIRYAETGEIAPCLRFGEIFKLLTAHIGPVFLSQIAIWLASVLIFPIAIIITLGLLAFPLAVWVTVFASHMYGQIGRQIEQPVS